MDAGHIEPFHAGRVRLPQEGGKPVRGQHQVVIQPGPCPPRTSGAPTLLTRPFLWEAGAEDQHYLQHYPDGKNQFRPEPSASHVLPLVLRPRSRRGRRPITTTPARAASYGRRSPCT